MFDQTVTERQRIVALLHNCVLRFVQKTDVQAEVVQFELNTCIRDCKEISGNFSVVDGDVRHITFSGLIGGDKYRTSTSTPLA